MADSKRYVTIQGNLRDGGEAPQVIGTNVDLEQFISEYEDKYPDCSSLVISIVLPDPGVTHT